MDFEDRHTSLVKIARIALPILAVLIISSLFLFEREDALRDDAFVVADQIKEAASDQRITNPKYSGLSREGDAFTITAEEAFPDGPRPNSIEMNAPVILIETKRGLAIETQAQKGRIDFQKRNAALNGYVNLVASNGLSANSDMVFFDFETGTIESPNKIKAKSSIGSIEAGNMKTAPSQNNLENTAENIIYFADGVRVIYQPSGKYK
ncbi:MAG: LPS export ABC transporter periplasmic protein LptC [Pseudomonadota bacterium]